MTDETYNADYYERGVEKGLSGYTNYHWRPEYCLPLANELKERFVFGENETVLDFGCAKGYMVKAFRLLGVKAYGYDVSEYAVANADPVVKPFLYNFLPDAGEFGLVIAKDVLEHIPKEELQSTLKTLRELTTQVLFVVVPLGDNGVFRIREYELDRTHVVKEDEEWWINQFNQAGFVVEEFHYSFPGAKDHWQKVHPYGNGTFILRKKE